MYRPLCNGREVVYADPGDDSQWLGFRVRLRVRVRVKV